MVEKGKEMKLTLILPMKRYTNSMHSEWLVYNYVQTDIVFLYNKYNCYCKKYDKI